MVNETRKASAEQRKEESRKLAEYAENGKTFAEIEKKRIADQERRRFVKHILLASTCGYPFFRKEILRQQREQERIEKENEIRRKQMEKMEEEAKKRKEAEEMIRLLENEEKQLIQRLRRTQQMQHEVCSFCVLLLPSIFFRRLMVFFSDH
jgi:glutamate racemase